MDSKIKNVSSAKDPVKRIRIQATDQEKISANYKYLSDKGLVSKIQKELSNSTIEKKKIQGASLVAQWLRICLSMQGTRVRALVWEDPTCRGATGPVSHKY